MYKYKLFLIANYITLTAVCRNCLKYWLPQKTFFELIGQTFQAKVVNPRHQTPHGKQVVQPESQNILI